MGAWYSVMHLDPSNLNFLLQKLLPSRNCEIKINVSAVALVCFLFLRIFFSFEYQIELYVPVLVGNSDDVVSIPSRMGTVVAFCCSNNCILSD